MNEWDIVYSVFPAMRVEAIKMKINEQQIITNMLDGIISQVENINNSLKKIPDGNNETN